MITSNDRDFFHRRPLANAAFHCQGVREPARFCHVFELNNCEVPA